MKRNLKKKKLVLKMLKTFYSTKMNMTSHADIIGNLFRQ